MAVTAPGPPTRTGLITSASTASAVSRPRTSRTDAAASSAAIGTRTRRRSSARPSTSCAGSGCSTNSMSNRAIASSRSIAVARSQAPLTSSRRRMSGPTAARMARTRSTRTSVSRSAPALTLSVRKPDSTDWSAASAAAALPERRDRRVDADAVASGVRSGATGRVQVGRRALEGGVERPAGRAVRLELVIVGRRPGGALDRLADERGQDRLGHLAWPVRPPPRRARPGRRRRPAAGSRRRARPTSRSPSGTAGGTGSGRGRRRAHADVVTRRRRRPPSPTRTAARRRAPAGRSP